MTRRKAWRPFWKNERRISPTAREHVYFSPSRGYALEQFQQKCERFWLKLLFQGYRLVLDPNAQFRNRTITIMGRLRHEYVDVWRPVAAQYVGDEIYYILPEQASSADEHWEFGKMAMVHCAKVAFMNGVHLTAVRKADQNRR